MPKRAPSPSSPYDPFEVTTRVQAVRDFVGWLQAQSFERRRADGETLLAQYWADMSRRAELARHGLEPATHEDVERWRESGELHAALGMPTPIRPDLT